MVAGDLHVELVASVRRLPEFTAQMLQFRPKKVSKAQILPCRQKRLSH